MKRNKNSKELTFTYNVEIYDKQGKLVKTGLLTWSSGIPKLDIPQIGRNAVTPWIEDCSDYMCCNEDFTDNFKGWESDYDITSENGEIKFTPKKK